MKNEHLKYFCYNYFVAVILLLVQQWFLSSAAECCSKHLSSWTYNPVTIPRFQILACIIYLPLICSLQLNVVLVSKSLWKMPLFKNLSSKLDLFPMCPCVSALCFQFRLDSFSWLDHIVRKLSISLTLLRVPTIPPIVVHGSKLLNVPFMICAGT